MTVLTNRFLRILAGACLAASLSADGPVPRPSPDFVIQTTSGKPIQLSQYRGKVVALAFILTTCPHCQKTCGILSKMQDEYGPRGLQVLASATENAAVTNLPGFIERFHPSFPVGYNAHNNVIDYLEHPSMQPLYMPQLVFIDREGTIRAQYRGEDPFFSGDQEKNIRDQIEALLKEGRKK